MEEINRIELKPLSVNIAWKGRRFRTDDYKIYQKFMNIYLPKTIEIPEGHLKLSVTFGFSNRGADIDNPLKPFLDCLTAKYGVNDNRFYKLEVSKTIVKKGNEFIEFEITKHE